jgi:hypothetical protein
MQVTKFALPDYQHTPTESLKLALYTLVASNVAIDFALPELDVRGWPPGSLAA